MSWLIVDYDTDTISILSQCEERTYSSKNKYNLKEKKKEFS